ncbi:MAG: heme A synthase [Nitriliruptoraceae bacterium]|nr:heme A synthase [Nitriliruptoraceae bacterium]
MDSTPTSTGPAPRSGLLRRLAPSPENYRSATEWRRLHLAAVWAVATNIVIVFTGGIVRVTGSGLGCTDWPTCDGRNITPLASTSEHSTLQGYIEFGNRLLSAPVLLSVLAVVWLLWRTGPHPRPLTRLAIALPAGVAAQIVLGGITVQQQLAPPFVMAHFLLSMVLIWVAMGVYTRVRPHRDAAPARGLQHATTAIAVVAAVVLVLGTLVTGAGPHGGDPGAPRLNLDIRLMAIAHADAVWMLIGRPGACGADTGPPTTGGGAPAAKVLLALELAQGGIGYLQYWLGIPPSLVSLHIVGAAVLWAAVAALWFRARPTPPLGDPPTDTQAGARDTASEQHPERAEA